MAEITGNGSSRSGGYYKHVWSGLAQGDTGTPISLSQFRGASVQATGTFSTGGQVDIQGSNDGGSTWATLDNLSDSALELTDTSIEGIREYTELIRPSVSAGDGSTLVDVNLVAVKPL